MSMEYTLLVEKIAMNVWKYYTPVLFFLGTIGNCLCVCLSRRTEIKKSASIYYFVALSISNEGYLLYILINWLFAFGGYSWYDSDFCKLFAYIPTLCRFLSGCFIVAFTVERFITVSFSPRLHAICTVVGARRIIIGLTCLGFILASPLLWIHNSDCTVDEEWRTWRFFFSIANTVIVEVVPFTMITVLNILIITAIRRQAGRITSTNTTTSDTDEVTVGAQNSCDTNSQNAKITKILLIVSSVFLCLNLPSTIMNLYYFLQRERMSHATVILWSIFNLLLVPTSFGINFFLCCASEPYFWKSALGLIKCSRRSRLPQPSVFPRRNPIVDV